MQRGYDGRQASLQLLYKPEHTQSWVDVVPREDPPGSDKGRVCQTRNHGGAPSSPDVGSFGEQTANRTHSLHLEACNQPGAIRSRGRESHQLKTTASHLSIQPHGGRLSVAGDFP